jgi:hypothetical protein
MENNLELLKLLDFVQEIADGEWPDASQDCRDKAQQLLNDYLKSTGPKKKTIKPKNPPVYPP